MASLVFDHVAKSYDGKAFVLKDINANVGDGEFLVIVGPSGCGKSTLLRMVAGLETVTSGEIRINDRVVNRLEPKDRDIAMVFQNYALYPHMSVYDNMAYGLKIRRMSKEEIRSRVEKAAAILELKDLLARKPRELSGGQRQRVAMGRAIVREPAVFLFDEPLSNLDAKLRVQMRSEIQNLHSRLRTTSLYVTHDQVEAMTLADRAIVLDKGNIEQFGTPTEIYDKPATLFVANFIGSPPMNLLSGRVTPEGNKFAIADGPVLPLSHGVTQFAGRELVLGVRPENLHANGVVANAARVELTVEYCERLGAENLAYGHWGKQNVVARLPHQILPNSGERLSLAAEPALFHLFDSDSGKRIDA
ncbi:MAG: sn-glycerol-3-phosphate import ATP-binding protein UgpC [Candidatus Eremiobacteraeota bacterium]|nr:sn-glycerol-3-phosphate import ATP-binding protein UgpC [Candidatus Eremiobacteraeota bacterium]